jgi:NADPH-dependent 2,4-dienoyl-CoA reductase/sulfur reductase-like enzyme
MPAPASASPTPTTARRRAHRGSAAEVFAAPTWSSRSRNRRPAEFPLTRPGPDPLRLPALRARSRPDAARHRLRPVLRRLRDRHRRARRPAAAGADVERRRPHGDAGRRLGAADGQRRLRRAARRRARRAAGKVVIVGAGSVGTNALQIAVGMGAQVTLFDRGDEDRARPHLPRPHRHLRRRPDSRSSAPSPTPTSSSAPC